MKRRIYITFLGLVLLTFLVKPGNVFAQQDPMYTQYMDNLLVINPAFAGTKGIGNVMLVARNQWVSFDGAPSTRSFAYNTPMQNDKIGIGFSLLSDKIGPLKQTGVYLDYAYFLKLSEKFRLSLGLKAGVSFYRANLTELLTIAPDPLFDNDIYANFLPNAGFGAYVFSDDMYFGLSIPKMIENRITKEGIATEYVGKQRIHIYLIAGKIFEISEDIDLKTASMFKWVKYAPSSFDITAMVGFKEKFWVGGMIRFGASYGLLAQFKPTEKMTIGYSYDFTITELNSYHNGTHEIMFSYDFDLFNSNE